MNDFNINEKATPAANDWGSRNHIHTLLLIALTVAGIYSCYQLTVPFIPVFTWALALAVLFAPLYRWLAPKIKHPNLTAAICVVAAALIVVVPATYVAERIMGEAVIGAETIKTLIESGEWSRVLDAHPRIAPVGHWIEHQFDLPAMINNAASWLTSSAASFVHGSVLQLIGVVLTFYMFFYFLRDRSVMLESLRSLSPLTGLDMNRMFDGVSDTVHATVYGTFVVSIVQGTLGGLMFWWLDLPAPFLWGIVMALLAVVPVLGAFIVWIPAALFLFLSGSEGKALLLTLWGAIVVGGIDNLLYPILVGSRLKIHTVLAFVSIVGGLIVFGASGLILGPVIFTITRILLEIWSSQNKAEQAADKADNKS
jgi:predicted PurR-regulated permease PerM